MHPQNIPYILQQTVEVARASFPKGNIYMQIRDSLGSIFDSEVFVDLFSTKGQPAYAPWRLALVCIMQFRSRQFPGGIRPCGSLRHCYVAHSTGNNFWLKTLPPQRDR